LLEVEEHLINKVVAVELVVIEKIKQVMILIRHHH
jgi:hypothetical protein